ncbi:MAG TPA: FAD-dependent oxidoreductase [Solirubrobacteraceae bacterium]|nr:FAD-dependent oxidoreductase [Solirubrobacteraceae bacterium]
MANQTFIIVGASLTGAKAAEELRTQGFDGHMVLIGAERERPYERPPLTKDYLRGESPRENAYVHPVGFYAERGRTPRGQRRSADPSAVNTLCSGLDGSVGSRQSLEQWTGNRGTQQSPDPFPARPAVPGQEPGSRPQPSGPVPAHRR